jgi:S1-C subfamily serine protease
MRIWLADLTGLTIGFALGGAVLVHYLPQIERWNQPTAAIVARPSAPALPDIQPPPRQPPNVAAPAVAAPTVAAPAVAAPIGAKPIGAMPIGAMPTGATPGAAIPAPLPNLAMFGPAPLPSVVHPGAPGQATEPPAPGQGMAGTGFFVGDSLLMTAAHVVPGCQRTQIVSQFIGLTAVRVLARDTQHDIALLRAPHLTAPAIMAIGTPIGTRFLVLGFPASAGQRVPVETWGTLENAKLPHQATTLTDPSETIWMQALEVTHGFSGGPIFDPRSGKVVGIVRGMVDGDRLRTVRGMPTVGVTIGPGSARLNALLQQTAPGTDAFPADQWGEDPLTVARRATVHVYCWN